MSFPVVAVVGRPNVGKSTLFNRLVRRQLAIVHDEPGVTRDRHYAAAWALGRSYLLVDTGGLDPTSDDPMRQRIAGQVKLAVAEADVIVCILDATTGATDTDREAIQLLRRTKKPVIYAANKADTKKSESDVLDLYRLGIDAVLPISALHGRGFGELETAIVAALPKESEAPDDPALAGIPRIAVIGRPNAGKSSLVNALAGENRMIVDDTPGTTRDAIDIVVERGGKKLVVIDTAGIRRKSKVHKEASAIEAASVLQAIKAMERAEVVVLMCDAAEGVAEQDAKILGLAVNRGRGIVVGLNKTDLLSAEQRKKLEESAREKLSFAPFAPFVPLSVKTGRGVGALVETIGRVHESFHKRVKTGELNRFFEQVLATRPPPTMGNRAPRLFFITQAESAPPLFVVMSNEPEHLHFSYQRFVINQIRKTFGFEGVPVRVTYKRRRRRGDEARANAEPKRPVRHGQRERKR